MYNTKVVELEKDMIELLNNANVHLATAKLVVDKVGRMINDALLQELKKEKEEELEKNN